MPQFDTFIFFNAQIYLIVVFIIYLYFNNVHFLPYLATILKLRTMILNKTITLKHNKSSLPLNLLQKSSLLTNII